MQSPATLTCARRKGSVARGDGGGAVEAIFDHRVLDVPGINSHDIDEERGHATATVVDLGVSDDRLAAGHGVGDFGCSSGQARQRFCRRSWSACRPRCADRPSSASWPVMTIFGLPSAAGPTWPSSRGLHAASAVPSFGARMPVMIGMAMAIMPSRQHRVDDALGVSGSSRPPSLRA